MKRLTRLGLAIVVVSGLLFSGGCIQPNTPSRQNSDIRLTQTEELNTVGFARDVVVLQDTLMFVAAGQAGGQIWTKRNAGWGLRYEYEFSTSELELVRFDPINHLWFASDKHSGYILPLDNTNLKPDSAYSPINFSDSNTMDFVVTGQPDSINLWLADGDGSDGLKYFSMRKILDPILGTPAWDVPTGEKVKTSSYNGLDKLGNRLATARQQLGVEIFDLPVQAGSAPVLSADTPGEALDVTFYRDFLLVADNWAGMTMLKIDDSTLTHTSELVLNGWVKHIDLWGNYAFLSCAGNGLFVAKLDTAGGTAKIDYKLPLTYVYDVFISGNTLYAAGREGVKIFRIEHN